MKNVRYRHDGDQPTLCSISSQQIPPQNSVRFIDLFAGIGGIRKGFELACSERGIRTQCVFTSEIKPAALDVLRQNHPGEAIAGDITQVDARDIPPFDFLLAGFPCQAFSVAGKRLGFEDTRGTLFFDVARILKEHRPQGFLLENVEGLVIHDRASRSDKMGRTLTIILGTLAELGYHVAWRVLNAREFGVAQDRKRIYIVGTRTEAPDLSAFPVRQNTLESVLEHGKPLADTPFVRRLLACVPLAELAGKAVKDKRGGANNIHAWDLELKGSVTPAEKKLLNQLLRERRKKRWAAAYGIDWMDGMPLTEGMIRTFCSAPDLHAMLGDLTAKGYVKLEHPKKKVGGRRVPDTALPLGYNIVTGKMSFEVNKVLDPQDVAPTLVAMDMQHLYVIDGAGIRPLTLREGLRLFGYPDDYKFDVKASDGYDLLGNTVVVPVIKAVASRLMDAIAKGKEAEDHAIDGAASL